MISPTSSLARSERVGSPPATEPIAAMARLRIAGCSASSSEWPLRCWAGQSALTRSSSADSHLRGAFLPPVRPFSPLKGANCRLRSSCTTVRCKLTFESRRGIRRCALDGRGRLPLLKPLCLPTASNGVSGFLVRRPPSLRLPLVPELLAFGQRQLNFYFAVLEVHPNGNQG